MKIIISGGTIVNEGTTQRGDIIIENDRIKDIITNDGTPRGDYDKQVDATGCFVLPGVIDEHVHFREPGLTAKADIESETRAAAWGGVTSYFDMPNCVPQTTTLAAWEEKRQLAQRKSHVNYAFFYGATNDNASTFHLLDRQRVPGIKLFMGASTGDMLVDRYGALLQIFQTAASLGLIVMTHCENTETIRQNMAQMKKAYGPDPDILLHPLIRSAEACYESSALATSLARQFGTRLHVAHLSTERELELFEPATDRLPSITAEACIGHLLFNSQDYVQKRALIKCNPAVKTTDDQQALRQALSDGRIATVATDHAPHELDKKQGGCAQAASGMPMIQFALPAMLQLVDEHVLTVERVVALMCHHPARLFGVQGRGFLRPGYYADLAIVRPASPWTVTGSCIQSRCGWSPMTGRTLNWRVEQTICNGHLIYDQGTFDPQPKGRELIFSHG